jgi:hypothetical protein
MATPAQITANQNNAARSTGPKTPEGKSAAARNSTKHGLSGAFTVLPHEDQDEFDVLLACLRDELQPANQHESFLVEQMAQSHWRLSRARRIETAIFDHMLGTDQCVPTLGGRTSMSPLFGDIPVRPPGQHVPIQDPDQRIAANLLKGGDRALATIQRYASAAERSYYKAHAELLKSRQLRNEAKTVETIDAAVIGRLVNAPPPRVRNEPKFFTAPGENLALRL